MIKQTLEEWRNEAASRFGKKVLNGNFSVLNVKVFKLGKTLSMQE